MKNSILVLGITLVTLSNVCNASNVKSDLIYQGNVLSDSDIVLESNEPGKVVKPYLKADTETFNPDTVIRYDNRKTVKEVISEDDKIIEYTNTDEMEFNALEESMKEVIVQSDLITEFNTSSEDYTIYTGRSIEDEIAELELITENNESNETSPLDFKIINSNSMMLSKFNSKTYVGMK
ncbi:hypothetical protein [Flavobacterium aestivum]|uniref:hypothetical protein n=1 Tax=Flavobacterium aestivum TaxID=3003257 RepID=UPI00228556AB|nr:hypothetical protein [Flavobacterium aestivum]